ncbi:MAG: amino acid ABC transporter permease [Solirubrobacteraceae bacterium]|jgi:polar amino acid transport system permease protein
MSGSESLQPLPGAGDTPQRGLAGLELIPRRHYGRWVAAVAVLVPLGGLIWAWANAQLDWSVVADYFTASTIIVGFLHTLLLTAVAMVLGMLLGVIFAVMRLSSNPVTSSVAWLYVWAFRGVPTLVQLLLWFNLAIVFPTLGVPGVFHVQTIAVITPFMAATLGLGVNEGAYLTELVRGGIISVDEGQHEAATALGLSQAQSLRDVILPQAMRVIVPGLGNETIGMLKMSSLASVIAYSELLNEAQKVYFVNARVIELLLVAAGWYLIATSALSIGQYYIERRLGRGLQRVRPRSAVERLIIHVLERISARRRGSGTA